MLGAGCPRVTHPFAARAPHPKVRASLDLHVLSTPPAFVLSQDQTLREGLLTLLRPVITGRRMSTQKVTVYTARSLVHASWLIARCTKGIVRASTKDGRGRGYAYGTNFRHAVEFSRSGGTPARTFRNRLGATHETLLGSIGPVNPADPYMAVRQNADL